MFNSTSTYHNVETILQNVKPYYKRSQTGQSIYSLSSKLTGKEGKYEHSKELNAQHQGEV